MRHYKTVHSFKKYGFTQQATIYKQKKGGYKVDMDITFPVDNKTKREEWIMTYPNLTHPSPSKFARLVRDLIYDRIEEITNAEPESSECCGAKFMDDSDLCPKCGDHTGREL